MENRSLLIASLAINVALVLFVILQLTPPDHSVTNISPQSDSRTTITTTDKISEASRAIAAALQRRDFKNLRDELLAAGVPEDMVASFIRSLVLQSYQARRKAIGLPNPSAWWKTSATFFSLTEAQKAQTEALQTEMKEEMTRLFGPNTSMGRDYGFLPMKKREALQKLESDYHDLSQRLARETLSFRMESDAEKATFVQEEKRRDLAALLTPAELNEYNLRNSSTAQRLRSRMTEMDATEEEYRAIFALQKSFDDRYNPDFIDEAGNTLSLNNHAQAGKSPGAPELTDEEARKQLNARLKATLGEARYQDYMLSDNQEYLALKAAAQRFNLPAETPKKLFNLETEVPATAARIADDSSLTLEQKKQALVQLGKTNRDKLYTLIGTEAGDAILASHRLNWIEQLESGFIPTINENGQKGIRRLGQPANAGSR